MIVKLEHDIEVEASPDAVRAFLDDVPAVIRCLPNLEDVREVEPGVFDGQARVKAGFMSIAISARARAEKRQDGSWRLEGEGRDLRGNGVARGDLEAKVSERPGGRALVRITAELHLAGLLGGLGEALMKGKADARVLEFADNLRKALRAA